MIVGKLDDFETDNNVVFPLASTKLAAHHRCYASRRQPTSSSQSVTDPGPEATLPTLLPGGRLGLGDNDVHSDSAPHKPRISVVLASANRAGSLQVPRSSAASSR
ncbi:hypothetical protein WA026_005418 [Henosepilachna vigintioctopunctata]|uniref:Uncharacterized protein n=1 Tax=Henosepilachna vigintioctopunctata TaxID=420089 RepID=A0AAW1TW89_9CUCU